MISCNLLGQSSQHDEKVPEVVVRQSLLAPCRPQYQVEAEEAGGQSQDENDTRCPGVRSEAFQECQDTTQVTTRKLDEQMISEIQESYTAW